MSYEDSYEANLKRFIWSKSSPKYILCGCCSVIKSCPVLCVPMDWCMAGFPVLHYLSEFDKIHVHWVSDAIKSYHALLSLLLLLSIFPNIRVFSNEPFSYQVAKVLELQVQQQYFQWIFKVGFLSDWLIWSPCSPRDSQESSPAVGSIPGQEDPLEEEMATYSSILACEIPWTEDPCGLQPVGLQKSRAPFSN